MTDIRPLNLTHVARIGTATGSTIEPPFSETWTDTQKIAWHAAVVADETGLPITVYAVGRDYAITVGHISHSQRPFRDVWTLLNGISTGARAAQRAREDGHTGASAATEAARGPEPAEDANGAQTGAESRDADDDWTRAPEQRNTRLRAEVGQLRADVDHRDQTIRHLEAGLRHERDIVDRVRAIAKNYPGLTALRNALADHATPGEVLPDELLRLLDMNRYVSTACDTAGACETAAGDHTDNADQLTERAAQLHARCRRTHKFTGQPCGCDCHHQTHP